MRERWEGSDKGLIWCWERGRQKRAEQPELAARAHNGELVTLVWKGGVEKKIDIEKQRGSLQYLATWQGLRGADLDIAISGGRIFVCTKTGQADVFRARSPKEEE